MLKRFGTGRIWMVAGALLLGSIRLQAQSLASPSTLEFGEVVVAPTGGSLTLDPATGAITGSTSVYPTSGLATSASAIVATDRAKRTAYVYTTISSFTMSGPGGSFAVSPGPFYTEYPGDTFTFPGNRGNVSLTFHVGGTLAIPANQPAGDYTGVLPIFIQDNVGNNSNTVSLPIHIRLIAPIALNRTQDLDMGIVVPGSTSGSVTLNPTTGAQGVTGGVLYASGTGQPALFSATGEPNHAFSVSLGSSTVSLAGPSGAMSLALTASPSGLSTFNGSGTATVSLGGTLSVGANQAEGDYLGTISVTVAYP